MEFIKETSQFILEYGLDVLSLVTGALTIFSFLADAKSKNGKEFKLSRRSAVLFFLAATCIACVIVSSGRKPSEDDPVHIGSPSQTVPVSSNEGLFVSDFYTPDYDDLPDGVASGWGDSENGRDSYTTDQINGGF